MMQDPKVRERRIAVICGLLLAALGSRSTAEPVLTDRGAPLRGHARADEVKGIASCAEMLATAGSDQKTTLSNAKKATAAVCAGDKVRAQHIALCISTTVTNPDNPSGRVSPGESETGDFDAGCRRRAPAKIVMRLDEITRRAGTGAARKYLQNTVWYHEWVHTEQTRPIETSLDKQCFDHISMSGLSDKEDSAVVLAAQAVRVEQAYNEFDAIFKELCAVAQLCDVRTGTISGAQKNHMKDKLSSLCERLDKKCKEFEMEHAAFDDALADFAADPANAACVTEVEGQPPIVTVTLTANKTDKDGEETGATTMITLKLSEYASQIDMYQTEKDKKTDKQGEMHDMPSMVDMKKEAITSRFDEC